MKKIVFAIACAVFMCGGVQAMESKSEFPEETILQVIKIIKEVVEESERGKKQEKVKEAGNGDSANSPWLQMLEPLVLDSNCLRLQGFNKKLFSQVSVAPAENIRMTPAGVIEQWIEEARQQPEMEEVAPLLAEALALSRRRRSSK